MRATKKTTKKTFKPDYIVDITDVETAHQTFFKFGMTKFNNRIPLEITELSAIILSTAHATLEAAELAFAEHVSMILNSITNTVCEECKTKVKPSKNIFKRFWNWLTNKK